MAEHITDNTINKFKEFEKFGSILGLERMTALMDKLGNPQDELKYIHVAGTNGKGSVCRYIYEALQENGYKVGLFTSPFLEVFNERIEFDRHLISDEDLKLCTDKVLEKVDELVAEGEDSPTEFEVITAVAFVYFAMKKADFVVLEVGLGGRGDSTNIIKKPEVCIITSISPDHTDRLGTTLSEIAAEKAGIIKEGVPVVMNVADKEAAKVIARKAYQMNAVLHDMEKIKYAIVEKSIFGYKVDSNIYGTDYSEMEISMLGKHQVQNVLTAVTAMELLRKKQVIKVERSKLYAGLKKAKQIGRFEIMNREAIAAGEEETLVILDGAHNEDGAAALKKTVEELLPGKKILMVTGMLADKDTGKILEAFTSIADDFIATEPDSDRKWEATELAKTLEGLGKNCMAEADPKKAAQLALSKKDEYDVVLTAGSLYLIGAIRSSMH